MTREQKIEWIEKAENKELVEQLRWAVGKMSMDNLQYQIEGCEEYELLTSEIMKRMNH